MRADKWYLIQILAKGAIPLLPTIGVPMNNKLYNLAIELGLKPLDEPIKPGDYYLARRNTGTHLLECKSVSERSYIVPVENAYCYNICDCIKIEKE